MASNEYVRASMESRLIWSCGDNPVKSIGVYGTGMHRGLLPKSTISPAGSLGVCLDAHRLRSSLIGRYR